MSEPKWMTVARGELGVRELPGQPSNPRILEYIRTVHGMEDDTEYAWCSAFVNWTMEQAGLRGTKRGAARSWLKWGQPIAAPRVGCVSVFWRESATGYKGHVHLHDRIDDKGQLCGLGGNQMNAVCVRGYPAFRLLGHRWPTAEMLAAMPATT